MPSKRSYNTRRSAPAARRRLIAIGALLLVMAAALAALARVVAQRGGTLEFEEGRPRTGPTKKLLSRLSSRPAIGPIEEADVGRRGPASHSGHGDGSGRGPGASERRQESQPAIEESEGEPVVEALVPITAVGERGYPLRPAPHLGLVGADDFSSRRGRSLDRVRDEQATALPVAAVARVLAGNIALLVLSAAISLGAWAAVPSLLVGWEPTVVMSGSMEPAIRRGDLVIVDRRAADLIKPGAVVVFDNPTAKGSLLHRVVSVEPDGRFRTKGDANAFQDSTPVQPSAVAGSGRLLVPLAGTPSLWVKEGSWLPIALVVGVAIAVVWCSRWSYVGRTDESARRVPARAMRGPHLERIFRRAA